MCCKIFSVIVTAKPLKRGHFVLGNLQKRISDFSQCTKYNLTTTCLKMSSKNNNLTVKQ